jgi:Rieske Fe-S protein
MNRRDFTKSCFLCVSAALAAPLLDGCKSTNYVNGTIEPNGLSVSKSEFKYMKNDQEVFRKYIVVRHDNLEFPIYVYRYSDMEYSAVLMKCTHQGNELQASGDYLHCSAHGSEFNNKGVVAQGPAEKNLRAFNVRPEAEKIFIDLRA